MATTCATICETDYSLGKLPSGGTLHISHRQSFLPTSTTLVAKGIHVAATIASEPIPPNTLNLLSLPLELRLQICSLALSSMLASSHPYSSFLSHRLPQARLSLLLTNRQIHAETRLLPFQHSAFFFQKYLSSSTSSCVRFLHTLQPWQIRAIRQVELAVVERDLVGWQLDYGWGQTCRLLGGANSDNSPSSQRSLGSEPPEYSYRSRHNTTDLRSLTLHIHGSLSRFATDILNGDAEWIKQGLSRLTSLRRVEIVVEDGEVGKEALRAFEAGLRERVEACGTGRWRVEVVVVGACAGSEGQDK